VVTGGLWFRRGYESAHKDRLIAGLQSLQTTPAGQQALTIFQADRITKQPSTCLDSAQALLAAHRRLFGPTNSTAADTGKTAPNMTKEQTK
jgi:hypothetical protein